MSFLIEIFPVIVFFLVFKLSDIFAATACMVVSAIITMAITYIREGRLSQMALISNSILIASSLITLLSGDSTYIKMKLTIISLIFAVILGFGLINKKGYIKFILGQAFEMDDVSWFILSRRFTIYFIFIAILNEIVWRNFSEDFWVNFKFFGYIPIMIIFSISQAPFILKNSENNDSNC